ncbi:hypothetical protein CCMSSC00406_0008560 [Pleurotus cornucopiae]|uniref:Uncharacterized protein n=1 Tax=Pleurotus cornucopiae TaxID=5321 RepID=A0ACB7IIC3_PLECO|nr:hypothetical protein CCMSSC00406_0008560 [Pleurotus cornucopiae]
MNFKLCSSFLAVLCVVALAVSAASCSRTPVVALDYSTFEGFTVGNVSQYLGMPFAAPPVGQLRFRKPSPPLHKRGVHRATEFGPACPQQALSPLPGIDFAGNYSSISEDCLSINVLCPAQPNAQLGKGYPVVVYFHGGGFEIGDATDTPASTLVERSIALGQPVIVVIPNYRINGLGFLAGREVLEAGVSNLGLHDQRFALEWIQKYISDFGGDPHKVTIWGVSAGAVSVALHLLNPNGNSLFHAAFMESGGPLQIPKVSDGQKEYDAIVDTVGCTHHRDTLACLRTVPLNALTAAINETRDIFSFSSLNLAWIPRVDGDLIKEEPYTLIRRKAYVKVPFITGNCDDEGTLFSLSNMNITTTPEFLDYISSNYLPSATAEQIQRIANVYPDDPSQGSPFDTGTANALTPQFKRLAAVQGDIFFQGPRRFLLETASETQNAWGYLNKQGKTSSSLGASHASDGGEWFGSRNPTEPFAVGAMINFINTFDPNVPANPHCVPKSSLFWPQWQASTGVPILVFSDPSKLSISNDTFRAEPMRVLNEILSLGAIESTPL